MTTPLTSLPAWTRLTHLARQESHQTPTVAQQFAADPLRFKRFSIQTAELLLDYSKQRINTDIMAALHALWHERDVAQWLQRMQDGAEINTSERRAALHVELRKPQPRAEVARVLQQMRDFCAAVHGGAWRGATGETITHVVNLGIGGSDLGPRMATLALTAYAQPGIRVSYVSNLDGAHLASTLARLEPGRTLFIISSKSFTTHETLTNAHSARRWLCEALGEAAVARHFVAISTNSAAVEAFGIPLAQMFEFWDWVGGRFSLWSAIGLPLALAVGYDNFQQLLAGAHAMDRHFFNTPVEHNLPATLALLGLWNIDFLGAETLAVLPYTQSLDYFPEYLQQLDMESNGKQVGRDGQAVGCATAPIVWGAAGSNGQHAFFQLLHQGGRLVPCDFIACRHTNFPLPGHHPAVLANCLAQSEALMRGKTLAQARAELTASGLPPERVDELAALQVFPGNQPSSTLMLPRLTPHTLGQLLALYEHKIFAQGCLWGINPFDQWGVEYGKQLARRLLPLLENPAAAEQTSTLAALDGSTRGLITWISTSSPA